MGNQFLSQISIPFGISFGADKILYTDWISPATESGAIKSYDLVTKETTILLDELNNPAGIIYVNTKMKSISEYAYRYIGV